MKTFLTATALLLAGTALANAEGTLQLFNWGNYTNPELLTKFEAETGIKVTVTDYDARSKRAAMAMTLWCRPTSMCKSMPKKA
jgi:spermidine/putrescine transport system substrate-binding protein